MHLSIAPLVSPTSKLPPSWVAPAPGGGLEGLDDRGRGGRWRREAVGRVNSRVDRGASGRGSLGILWWHGLAGAALERVFVVSRAGATSTRDTGVVAGVAGTLKSCRGDVYQGASTSLVGREQSASDAALTS